jgi:hypothetical protein
MNGTATLPHPIMLTLSGVGACAGAVALLTYFTVYAVLPARIERVEESNKLQDAKINEIQVDNAQRRELLAAALATLQQIDQRTKRIEDHILK